jgi:hypothetical protein
VFQRQAARDSIATLRKLVSAIEVGPSFNQYTDRLIDAKAQIDEKISVVPEGALKTEILNSVSAFLDARELWRLAIAYQDVHEYLIWACDLYVKYNRGSMARLARIVGVVNFLAYIKKSLYVVVGAVLTCAGAFWIRL